MITTTLVVILGTLLAVVLIKLVKKPAPPASRPQTAKPDPVDLANLKPADARPGDAISIAGAGDDMTDLDFTADRFVRVEAGTRRWSEVSGPYRERRVTLRAGGIEEPEVYLQSSPRKITLEDIGLSEEDLAEMDERQNTADNFGFDDKTWFYRFSREARCWGDDRQPLSGFYYWEFHEDGGGRVLALRKPEGEPFTVTQFSSILPGDVTIYRGR